MPSIIAFTGIRPMVTRLVHEAFGDDWMQAEVPRQAPDLAAPGASDRPVVLLDTVLDKRSVDFAKAARERSDVVGMVALLDTQKGNHEALQNEVGVRRVHAVVTLRDILFHILRADNGILTPRECISAMSDLQG